MGVHKALERARRAVDKRLPVRNRGRGLTGDPLVRHIFISP